MSSRNVIGELLNGGSVGTQAELARRAQVAKSTVSKAVNGGGMGIKAAHKSAPPLGVDGDVLYGAVNLAAALKALEDGEADEPDTLERIGRIVRTLGQRDADEDAEGMNEVLDAIEEAIENLTGAAVDSVRPDKATKPGAKTATKSGPPMHAAFKSVFDRVGTGSVDPGAYEVDDGRDFYGVKLSAARLRDQEESSFPDVSAFGTSNVPAGYDGGEDDDDLEERDALGRSTSPRR